MTQRDSDRDGFGSPDWSVPEEGTRRPSVQQQAFGGLRRQDGGHPLDDRSDWHAPPGGQQTGSYGADFGPPRDERFGGEHFQGGRGGGGYSRTFAEPLRDARPPHGQRPAAGWGADASEYGGYGNRGERAAGDWPSSAYGGERYPGERQAAERHAARNAYERARGTGHGDPYGSSAYGQPQGGFASERSPGRHHVAGADGGDWTGRDDTAYRDRHAPDRGGHHHDADYLQWRAEQLRRLDEDYHAWREARYRRFSDEFNQWREQRASGRGPTAGNPALSGMQGTDTTGRAGGLGDTEAPPRGASMSQGQADPGPDRHGPAATAADAPGSAAPERDLGTARRTTAPSK